MISKADRKSQSLCVRHQLLMIQKMYRRILLMIQVMQHYVCGGAEAEQAQRDQNSLLHIAGVPHLHGFRVKCLFV